MRFLLVIAVLCLVVNSVHAADPVHLDRDGEKWAEKTLKKMTLEEKVGQLFMVWVKAEFFNVDSPQLRDLQTAIHKYYLGGFGLTVPVEAGQLLKTQPFEAAALLNELQSTSQFPLLIAADFERGISMRVNGGTGFPHSMAFGAARDRNLAFNFGKITAEEARAIGVHWNWFPDADVNSNPANPIINIRSFGEDPVQVSGLVTAYIAGARGAGMLTTVKHFPGHGDTATDSHLAVARTNATRERLDDVELVPFRTAIRTGVDSVMVGHITVPALEQNPDRPASISHDVITGLLRNDMGFEGVIVSDALDMNALTQLFRANSRAEMSGRVAVEAFKAGNDVLIIPSDLDGAYNGMLRAVRSGEIPEDRLNESVLRVLKMKASVGLHKKRTVDLNQLMSSIGRPENLATAQRVAESAVTLVRNNGLALPIRKSNGTASSTATYQTVRAGSRVVCVVFTSDIKSDNGRTFASQLRLRVPDARVIYVDESLAGALTPQILEAARTAETVIAVVDTIPTAGGGARFTPNATGLVGLPQDGTSLLARVIQQAGAKTVVVASGNPYIISSVPEIQTYLCTFSDVPASDTAVVRALFGEIPIRGHMPVTIPGIAERGTGIELAAVR